MSDLERFALTITSDRDDSGTSTPGAFQQQITSSSNLVFEGAAYLLLKQWLIDDISAPLNRVLVKVEHVGCGTYEDLTIRGKDLVFCDDVNKLCTFDVVLKQDDQTLRCVQNTLITDNHLGWFPTDSQIPANGKKHPRFSYCNEIRPNALLVFLWSIGVVVWVILAVFLVAIYTIINALIIVLNIIIGVINAIIAVVNTFGAGLNPIPYEPLLDYGDIVDDFTDKFIESAGCGREHPNPLIRDYIYNVCTKCGLDVNDLPTTVSIFFAPNITVQDSDKATKAIQNPYYNACLQHAPGAKGIRRVEYISLIGGNQYDTTSFWIPENSPIYTLDVFLDLIKGVWNAEWRVTNNKLYFQRKDFYINGGHVLDFTVNGADRNKLIEGICFEPNDVKLPASCIGIYSEDAIDVCGNEAKGRMNGYPIVFGKTDENPLFNGMLDKTTQLSATKFRFDGASTDYISDALQVAINSKIFNLLLVPIFKFIVVPAFEKYADYALLLKDDTSSQPKIIIWDGREYLNAKAVRTKGAHPTTGYNTPAINQPYNNYPSPTPWEVRYPAKTSVLGSAQTPNTTPPGFYLVEDIFGIQIYRQPALLPNYPMYFEGGYKETLWDYWHWIDDPKRNPKQLYTWTGKMELCCDTLQQVQAFSGGILGQKAKLPFAFYPDAVIKEIEVNYEASEAGQYILLKGTT